MATLGAPRDVPSGGENSAEVEDLARFAVAEHNKKENALLEFGRVVKAKEQVVAGTLHHLTVEAIDAGKKKIYEAKVWVKPWLNFKELQEFRPAGDTPTVTPPGDGHEPVWRMFQDVGNHALKTIQQSSNSLSAYELLEIFLAKADVIEETAEFDMLKVRRGSKI